MRTIVQKIEIKKHAKAHFVQTPKEAIELPDTDVVKKLSGEFDYIHLFVKTQNPFA